MPQVGERKSKGGVTGEWDGSTWVQVHDAPPSADSQAPSVMRFLGGAAKTSPLNPMNLASAAMHPLDTLWNTVATPIDEARQAIKSGAETVTGSGANGRMVSAAEMFKHLGGAVPFVGKAAADAGTKIGEGDWAGGAGELTGLASGALLPKVPGAVADSLEGIGRGAETLGKSKPLARAQALAPLEAMTGHPLAAAASIAAPPLLRGGGRVMQKGGAALNGLIDAVKKPGAVEAEAAPYESASTELPYNWGWHKLPGEAAAKSPVVEPNAFTGDLESPRMSGGKRVGPGFTHEGFLDDLKGSIPDAPIGRQDLTGALADLSNSVRRSNLSPVARFLEDDPQAAIGGEGRMTGQFEEGNGGLSDVAAGNITPNINPEVLNRLDSRITGVLSPEAEAAAVDSLGLKLSPLDELSRLSRRSTFARASKVGR